MRIDSKKKKNGKSETNSKRNVFEIVSFATRRATRREEKSSSGASHMVGRRSEEKGREGPRWRDHAPNDLLATITPHERVAQGVIPLQKVLLLKTLFLFVPVNPNPNFFSLVTLTLLWGGSVVQVHVKYATDEPAKAMDGTKPVITFVQNCLFWGENGEIPGF